MRKLLLTLLIVLAASRLIAQDMPPPQTCNLLPTWTAASNACISRPGGYVCNGGSAPVVEPVGPVSNALGPVGALVEIDAVDFVRTAPFAADMTTAGIVWLRATGSLNYTALMLGDVALRDASPPDFPAWTSLQVETSGAASGCSTAPLSGLVVQSALGSAAQIVVNGVSLRLSGTVLIVTNPTHTRFIALSGQHTILAFGSERTLWMGQEVNVLRDGANPFAPSNIPSESFPLDAALLINLPVALFDRPVILPQPGFVMTQGAVNLRSSPDQYAGLIMQVPPGQVLSVLGRNPEGTWYHVRLDSGETGWMLAELLAQNLGAITAVYNATPLPPQRYGDLGTRAQVNAPAGAALRHGPEISFPLVTTLPDGALVTLLARSPYSPWVKIEVGGYTGWIALIALQTQAYIDALPVDASAPPPPATPTPTNIPGLGGNAFPDPDRPGNP
jgi:uncharacterized protein YgiM (DUF1202 family)